MRLPKIIVLLAALALETLQVLSQGSSSGNTDFVPGNKVVFQDNFSKDAKGDFPARWNTNGTGQVVNIEGQTGNWLEVGFKSAVIPQIKGPLPENCTIEFDLYMKEATRVPRITFGTTRVKDVLKEKLIHSPRLYVAIDRTAKKLFLDYGMVSSIGKKDDFPFETYVGKPLHIAIAINKSRFRCYLDGTKVIDLPSALTDNRNSFFIASWDKGGTPETGIYVTNIRIAETGTDNRSLLIKQLMEEGKAVTNDILFDVNSDVIKKESYPVINQFGEALQQNDGLKIRIVGHTDSDGKAADNVDLSKRRAAAVKNYLQIKYEIDDSRINTDGKGASVPVADNKTDAGKAKNRRVEFVKL